jgi:hypothetical protein
MTGESVPTEHRSWDELADSIGRLLPGYYPPPRGPRGGGPIFDQFDQGRGGSQSPGGYTGGATGGGRGDRAFLSVVLSGIAVKLVGANLSDGGALTKAASQAITDWEDDYCGTPPRPIPTLAAAVALAEFAGTLDAGALQTAVQQEAAGLAQKAFATAPAAQTKAATASAASASR